MFRKVALERLSSPDQLDQLLQVTNPRGWLALGTLIVLILLASAWGVFGSLPTEAVGEGILIRQGGVSGVAAKGDGQVEEVLVEVGATLEEGQLVARIRQDAQERQIEDTAQRLEDKRQEYKTLQHYSDEQRRLGERDVEQQRTNLRRTIETIERESEILRERRVVEEELLGDGLVTKQTLLDTDQELNGALDRLESSRLELAQLDLRRLQEEQDLEQQQEVTAAEVRDLQLELRDLRAKLEENANIVSPFAGRVIERMVNPGDLIQLGTEVLSLEEVSEELLAVLFLPASQGKKVQVGMPARIAPSTVQREEYGYLVGEVRWVAEFPSTRRGMLRLLANEELVDKLLGEGPPIQVDVELFADPATPTGFRWSSSSGPDLEITSGTLAEGSVVLEEERPISLVIPKIREILGF